MSQSIATTHLIVVLVRTTTVVKVVMWSGGAHLTKPGWSKPHNHSTPN